MKIFYRTYRSIKSGTSRSLFVITLHIAEKHLAAECSSLRIDSHVERTPNQKPYHFSQSHCTRPTDSLKSSHWRADLVYFFPTNPCEAATLACKSFNSLSWKSFFSSSGRRTRQACLQSTNGATPETPGCVLWLVSAKNVKVSQNTSREKNTESTITI